MQKIVFFVGLLLAATGLLSPPLALAAGLVYGLTLAQPYPRERKSPQFRAGISDLAATSQGSLLLLNVGFQDVDWGSTTRGSEVRWRPEDALLVASD